MSRFNCSNCGRDLVLDTLQCPSCSRVNLSLLQRLRACAECEQAPLGPLLTEAANVIETLLPLPESTKAVTIDLERPDTWPTSVHSVINHHAQEMATTWQMAATLHDQLLGAIDPSGTMGQKEALEWVASAQALGVEAQEPQVAAWIRRFGYCTPEQSQEMAEFICQQIREATT